MARTTARRSGAAVAAVALAVGVSACGSDPEVTETGGQSSPGPEQQAPSVEPGEQIRADELLLRLASPGTETLSSFEFTLDTAAEQQQIAASGSVDLDGSSPAVDVSLDVDQLGTLALLVVDEAVYVSIPEITPPGQYFEVPVEELEGMGAAEITESLDLDALMQDWDAGAQSVTYVGPEEVNGAETEHYEIVVDPQEVMDAVGETMSPDAVPDETLTYGIWIDSDNLINQMAFDVDGSSATLLLDNWGKDVQVQAPDPADVVQMPSF